MWKDINGYEGLYQVSDDGRVKSAYRSGYDGRVVNERILKPCPVGSGYLTVCLRKDGKTRRKYIHRLVGECFVDNPYGLPVINHVDGDKRNNNYQNLEWVTYSRNNQHAYDVGLKGKGENFYNAKLSEESVDEGNRQGRPNLENMVTSNRIIIRSSNDYPGREYTTGETPAVEAPHL